MGGQGAGGWGGGWGAQTGAQKGGGGRPGHRRGWGGTGALSGWEGQNKRIAKLFGGAHLHRGCEAVLTCAAAERGDKDRPGAAVGQHNPQGGPGREG
jgi:hypothetical protein